MARLTTEEFIQKAREVHGDRYDYSKVEYVDSTTKVCIGCKKHGDFWQKPNIHLQGKGCFKCGREKIATSSRKSLELFLQDAKRIHGDRYNYSKVELVNYQTKVIIICPVHGEFTQSPTLHLQGSGCPKCGNERESLRMTTEGFIQKAKQIHGDRYDYSKVEYVGNKAKVCIICRDHGEFWQEAKEIIFYGHSVNEMDFRYFKSCLTSLSTTPNPSKHLTFITYDEASERNIKDNIQSQGVSVTGLYNNLRTFEFIYTQKYNNGDKTETQKFNNLLARLISSQEP